MPEKEASNEDLEALRRAAKWGVPLPDEGIPPPGPVYPPMGEPAPALDADFDPRN
jgi:hypothetical protein